MAQRTSAFVFVLSVATVVAGCAAELAEPTSTEGRSSESLAQPLIPAWGTSSTVDFATWNVEWFGQSNRGPTNEGLQLDNVAGIVAGGAIDVWALQEIVSSRQFGRLLDELPGYDGILANEVVDGRRYYFSAEQKPAFVWRRDTVELLSARVILGEEQFAFAGRPPIEARMRVRAGGQTAELYVITFHAKASSDQSSWERRRTGSAVLADYLARDRATDPVVLLGDFNDDLDESIRRRNPSPYASLVAVSGLTVATMPISQANEGTTVTGRFPLDHVVLREVSPFRYEMDSAEVLRPDERVPNYASTTSNHFPVGVRLSLGPVGLGQVVMNEILANEPGSDTRLEYVELVNSGTGAADLSGWAIADERSIRHVFAAGTSLAPGEALLVSARADYGPGTVLSSTGSLALNNTGDTAFLLDDGDNVIDEFRWTSSQDGVSFTRERTGDLSAAWVRHDVFGTPRSPLRTAAGGAF